MSLPEILVVVVLALVVFGPERIPRVARTVGKIMREARKAANEVRQTLDIEDVRRDLRARNLARHKSQSTTPRAAATASAPPGDEDEREPLVTPPPPALEPDQAAAAGLPEIRPAAGAVAVGATAAAAKPDAPARPAAPGQQARPQTEPATPGQQARPQTEPATPGQQARPQTEPATPGQQARPQRLREDAPQIDALLIDQRLERDLRGWLGLPVASPLTHVVLPPRGAPLGRLVQRPLARKQRGRPEQLSLVALPSAAHA